MLGQDRTNKLLEEWDSRERIFVLDFELTETLNLLYRVRSVYSYIVSHYLGGFAIYIKE
jgi:hypothetical protein